MSDHRQIAEQRGRATTIPQLATQGEALLIERLCRRIVALLDRQVSKGVERTCEAPAVIERLRKRKALLEQCPCGGKIGLMTGEAAGDVDRVRILQGGLRRCAFGEDPRTPFPPLANISPREPEAVHRPAESEIFLRSSLPKAPLERQAQIVVLLFKTPQPVGLLRTEQLLVRVL